MNTLVAIHSYPGAGPEVARRWPWYLRGDCDILGIGTSDGRTAWPKDKRLIGVELIGRNAYVQDDHLPRRLVRTFGLLEKYPIYDAICIIEWDSIFLQPVPEIHGLVTTLGGYLSPGFTGTRFFHTPWCADRMTAEKIARVGTIMIDHGLTERGFPDRFLGLLVDLYDIPVTFAHTFSVNRIDQPQYVKEARMAIRKGCWYCHGCKTADEIRAVTQGLIDG